LAITVARRNSARDRLDAIEVDMAQAVQACRAIDLSWAEIAQIMNMTAAAVTKRYGEHRGRRRRPGEDDESQPLLPFSGDYPLSAGETT
jgi:DNA-directed RNA polymerase specialized sigma24 family protein